MANLVGIHNIIFPKTGELLTNTIAPHLSDQFSMVLVTCSLVSGKLVIIFQIMFHSRTTGSPLKTGFQLWCKQCFGQETQLDALCGEPIMIIKLDYKHFSCIICNFTQLWKKTNNIAFSFCIFCWWSGHMFLPSCIYIDIRGIYQKVVKCIGIKCL